MHCSLQTVRKRILNLTRFGRDPMTTGFKTGWASFQAVAHTNGSL